VVFFLEVPTLHGGGNYLNWDTGNGDGFIDSFTIDKVLCPSVRRFGP
jgi:hypothetical protein